MSEHTVTQADQTHAAVHGDHHAGDHHAKAPRTYLLTLIALLTLTVITVGVSYIDFGAGNIVVAVTVATIKAFLVGLIFMHLLQDKPINAVIFCAAFLFLSLLFLFTFLDENSRNPIVISAPPAGGMPPSDMAVATAIDGKPIGSEVKKPTPALSSAPAYPNGAVPAPAAAATGPAATAASQEPPKK
jgi:caa(3)-type oxidase subunit IV